MGATFLAPLAHAYYDFQDWLVPDSLGLWGAPLKLVLDQTIYAGIYNCVFFFGIGGEQREGGRRV